MARVTLLATLLANVDGWTTTSQSVYGAQIGEIQNQMRGRPSIGAIRELGWLWHSPVNRDDTRGLGGGITWAMDAALCDLILPKFREDIFGAGKIVSCKEIHAAVARSFDKWAANNRNFKFTDMTKECTIAGLNFGPPTSGRRHTGTACTPANQPSGCVMPHSGCPLAEIWVTSKIGPFSTPASIAAASESSSVATALTHARYSTDFRYSNGARPFLNNSGVITYNRQVVETFAGTFSFETEKVCWYLDSEFCAPFHRLKKSLGSAGNARVLVWGLTFGFMTLAILFYLALVVRICLRVMQCTTLEEDAAKEDDEDGDGKLSIQERLNIFARVFASYNPFLLTIFILLLVLPALITTKIFAPCFDCFDFESATLHEIGHFLGLGHPDNIPDNWVGATDPGQGGTRPGNNSYHTLISASLMNGTRPDPAGFCMNPWAAVQAGVPPGAVYDTLKLNIRYPTRDAQMEAVTQHNPRTCLFSDDLEALAVLYPDCDQDLGLFEAVCHQVDLNLGIARIAAYVLIPAAIALFFIISLSSIVQCFERRERTRLAKKHQSEIAEVRLQAQKQQAKLEKAQQLRNSARFSSSARFSCTKSKKDVYDSAPVATAQVQMNVISNTAQGDDI